MADPVLLHRPSNLVEHYGFKAPFIYWWIAKANPPYESSAIRPSYANDGPDGSILFSAPYRGFIFAGCHT